MSAQSIPEQEMRQMFQDCMDQTAIDAAGEAALRKHLPQYPLLGDTIVPSLFSWENMAGQNSR